MGKIKMVLCFFVIFFSVINLGISQDPIQEFRVITWNVHELLWIPLIPSESPHEYIDISNYLKFKNADVLGVQECWNSPPNLYSTMLGSNGYTSTNSLEPIYTGSIINNLCPLNLFMGNGLASFSKFDVISKDKVKWNDCHGCIIDDVVGPPLIDCAAKKGFSKMTIKIPVENGTGFYYLDFYNIHADAGDLAADEFTRLDQITQLLNYISTNSKNSPVIIVGDFNLHCQDNSSIDISVRDMIKNYGFEQSDPSNTRTDHNSNNKLDYIFFRSGSNVMGGFCKIDRVSYAEVDDTIGLSDHFPIKSQFKIIRGIFAEGDFSTDGLTVHFTDNSKAYNCEITEWNWDFGDGSTSTLRNPTHTYQSQGDYSIKLTVKNNFGESDLFVLQPLVTELRVTSPDGGEVWLKGESKEIKWDFEQQGLPEKIYKATIRLVQGQNVFTIANGVNIRLKSFIWTVGDHLSGSVNPDTGYKINIQGLTDDNYVLMKDTSNYGFEIADPDPTMTVITPNGGEKWQVGSTQTIKWSSIGIEPYRKISIELIRGAALIGTIANDINVGDETFIWTVGTFYDGSTPTIADATNYKIAIERINASVYDQTDNYFEIYNGSSPLPFIEVTSPNGGESWNLNSTYNVTWNSSGITGDVIIQVIQGGVSQGTVYNGANTGSFNWDINNYLNGNPVVTGSYKLQVKSLNDTSILDQSNTDFLITDTITPTITVTSPNGGETLTRGTDHAITWTGSGLTGNVNLILWNGSNNLGQIAQNQPLSGSYTWHIGDALVNPAGTTYPDGSDYKVMVKSIDDLTISDSSDAVFTIIDSSTPKTYTIYSTNVANAWRWDWESRATGSADGQKAICEYYDDYQGTDPLIANSFGSWTLPAGETITKVEISAKVAWSTNVGNHIKLRDETHGVDTGWVTYTGNSLGWVTLDVTSRETSWTKAKVDALDISVKRRWFDEPNNADFYVDAFKIVITTLPPLDPTITVTSPNGGESWELGSTYNVTWNSSGITGDVIIQVMQGGVSQGAIYNGANTGSFNWTIDNYLSGTPINTGSYKLQVKSLSDTSIKDQSDAEFSVTNESTPFIEVNEPGTGYNWVTGDSYYIRWNTSSGLSGTNVKIRLFQNGSLVLKIVDDTANNGEYYWTVPASIASGTDYQIRVKTVDNAYYDDGDIFEITNNSTPKTYTIYSTNIANAWRWDWESRATGSGDGQKAICEYYDDYQGTDPLIANSFGSWTLPAGETITKVEISAKVAWNTNGGSHIKLRDETHGIDTGWITYTGNSLGWVTLNVTSREASWTKAKVDALNISVKRRWFDEPNNADFYVDAFKIVITTQ